MIEMGDGWSAESGRISHACSPDVRAQLLDDGGRCACGQPVPRRVERFRSWLVRNPLGVLLLSAQVTPKQE